MHPEIYSTKSSFRCHVSFLISNKDNLAHNVTLNLNTKFKEWQFHSETSESYTFPKTYINLVSIMINGMYNSILPGCACTFNFDYSDQLGNKYRQFIVFSVMNDVPEIKTSIPVLQGKPILKVI